MPTTTMIFQKRSHRSATEVPCICGCIERDSARSSSLVNYRSAMQCISFAALTRTSKNQRNIRVSGRALFSQYRESVVLITTNRALRINVHSRYWIHTGLCTGLTVSLMISVELLGPSSLAAMRSPTWPRQIGKYVTCVTCALVLPLSTKFDWIWFLVVLTTIIRASSPL